MKKITFTLLICLLFVSKVNALVTFGGYVPFGMSTQSEPDGGRNTFSFDPAISVNTIFPIEMIGHHFMPEIGLVAHGSDDYEDYSKTTLFILLDLGYPLTEGLALRYGIGTFLTKIKGAGGTVQRRNGSSTDTFDRPAKTSTSYNTTINLGAEYRWNKNWSARLETFVFSVLNNEARNLSYMITFNYYLGE